MRRAFLATMALLAVVPISRSASSPQAASAADAYFSANGVTIHYIDKGQGEPVVLIHGLYSSAFINWQAPGIVNALAKTNRVIALDVPGHGHSAKPDDPNAYGLQLVEDVVALLDHLNIKQAHIVGYSMGGMITMKLLATHQDRVLSAVVGGMGWLRQGGMLQNVFGKMTGTATPGGTPPACATSLGKLALTEEELRNIKVPVEVVVGDRDPVRTLYVLPLQRVRGDWPVIQVKDAGHLNCIVKPQFKEAIVLWVSQHQ